MLVGKREFHLNFLHLTRRCLNKKRGVGQNIHNIEEYHTQKAIRPSVVTKGEEGGIFTSAVLLYWYLLGCIVTKKGNDQKTPANPEAQVLCKCLEEQSQTLQTAGLIFSAQTVKQGQLFSALSKTCCVCFLFSPQFKYITKRYTERTERAPRLTARKLACFKHCSVLILQRKCWDTLFFGKHLWKSQSHWEN